MREICKVLNLMYMAKRSIHLRAGCRPIFSAGSAKKAIKIELSFCSCGLGQLVTPAAVHSASKYSLKSYGGCDTPGIDISASNADALVEGTRQETQAKVKEDAQKVGVPSASCGCLRKREGRVGTFIVS